MLSTIQHAVSFYLENKWQLFNKFLQCLDNAFISNDEKDNGPFFVSCGKFFPLYLKGLLKNKQKKIDIDKKQSIKFIKQLIWTIFRFSALDEDETKNG